MSFDETLASRVRRVVSARSENVTERKMFGGLCFLVDGALCCGILDRDLIVRVGPERYAEALAQAHTRAFDFTGRTSRGMVHVSPAAIGTDAALTRWVQQGLAFAATRAHP